MPMILTTPYSLICHVKQLILFLALYINVLIRLQIVILQYLLQASDLFACTEDY